MFTKVRIQFLAAGQAPRPAHHLAAAAADPEPGRVCLAVDAHVVASAGLHAGFPPGQLFLRWRWQAVHRPPELVTSGAIQRDMLIGAVCARDREALRDLSGDAAIGACYDG